MNVLHRHAGISLLLLLLLLLLHALPVLPAHAAEEAPSCGLQTAGPSCAAEQPAGMSKGGGVSQEAGNPVNLVTGNKYQREVDMAPLPGVIGLELVRHYNSHSAAPGMPLSGAGRGWQFSYDTRLYAVGDTLQIIQADGTRLMFSRTAWSSTLCTAPDPAHGQVRISKQGRHQQYRWRWPNGRELAFDRNGRLTHIFAPSGEWLGIERDDVGRLRKVSDPQGRSMLFHYPGRKELKAGTYPGVQSVDTPTGRFLYNYGVPEADVAARDPARSANLTAVHLPTSYDPDKPREPFALGDTPTTSSISTIRRLYHYENPRFPTLLTGITVEGTGSDGRALRERIGTWAYDANGLAVLSIKGQAMQRGPDGKPLPGTGIEQVSIDRGMPGMVRLTNSLGQVTVYRHAIVAGDRRLLEVRGPGCASCGDTDVRYRYDPHGRLQEVTRLDEAGRPLEGRWKAADYGWTAWAASTASPWSPTCRARLSAASWCCASNMPIPAPITHGPIRGLRSIRMRPCLWRATASCRARTVNGASTTTGTSSRSGSPSMVSTRWTVAKWCAPRITATRASVAAACWWKSTAPCPTDPTPARRIRTSPATNGIRLARMWWPSPRPAAAVRSWNMTPTPGG